MKATIPASIGLALLLAAPAAPIEAQIARHPTGVNVNAMGVTTVFLTFGNLRGKVPVDALWCGELIPATPALGNRCDPATLFGRLPPRHDFSRLSGSDGFMDIMSIPASVARRAYQAAAAGAGSEFFYVRRFVDPRGGPDEYVSVTCRLTGGGARTPFAITEVRIAFATDDPVAAVRVGERVPPVAASFLFNGSGRLRGRWEIVRPGEPPPSAEDLLPEASLPLDVRARQRRYTEIARFDVFLPPLGEFTLVGPQPNELPSDASGQYLLLLRIEASDDKEGDSDLGAALAGSGLVHTGGVAGFPIPPLRYIVGSSGAVGVAASGFRGVLPAPGARLSAAAQVDFRWTPHAGALLYRLEVELLDGTPMLDAILRAPERAYKAPVWLRERVQGGSLRWRVAALGSGGQSIGSTTWLSVMFDQP